MRALSGLFQLIWFGCPHSDGKDTQKIGKRFFLKPLSSSRNRNKATTKNNKFKQKVKCLLTNPPPRRPKNSDKPLFTCSYFLLCIYKVYAVVRKIITLKETMLIIVQIVGWTIMKFNYNNQTITPISQQCSLDRSIDLSLSLSPYHFWMLESKQSFKVSFPNKRNVDMDELYGSNRCEVSYLHESDIRLDFQMRKKGKLVVVNKHHRQ